MSPLISRGLLVLVSMVMLAGGAQAQGTDLLKQRLDDVLKARETKLTRASVGIHVIDGVTGKELYAKNAENQFNIASNAKLFTTAAALGLLGPNYRFRTALYTDKLSDGAVGDLYIRGRGDPSLDTSKLHDLARRLRAMGIRKITGSLIVDSTYFDGVDLPPHFGERPEEESWYRSPIGATSLNNNVYNVRIRPALSGSGAAQVVVDPESPYLKLSSSVETVPRGRTAFEVKSINGKNGLEISVVGQIHGATFERKVARRVPDGIAYLGATLRAVLKTHGISMASTKVKKAAVPKTARYLVETESLPLSLVLQELGKQSDNYVAEMVLKNIGAATLPSPRPATWEDGLTQVKAFLEKEIGLKTGTYRYDNGSGLYDASRFSPKQVTQLLRTALHSARWGPEFIASLAVAGVDGTMAGRPLEPPVQGTVRAKTGSLAQASALSGFAAVAGMKPMVFSILVGGFAPEQIGEARALQDALARAVVEVAQGR